MRLHMVVRHNMPWADKVCDVTVELMGLTMDVIEAKSKIESEVEDFEQYKESEGPHDWAWSADGTLTLLCEHNEVAYDIIPLAVGFPNAYKRIVG
jgi:hypothetical protein